MSEPTHDDDVMVIREWLDNEELKSVDRIAVHRHRMERLINRLAAAEAELAALKQRIAAAPVAWVQFGSHNNPCEISEDRETFWDGEHPPGTLRQCRLLEVRDEE